MMIVVTMIKIIYYGIIKCIITVMEKNFYQNNLLAIAEELFFF